jgi:arylsulfatase A-like enzyme
MKRREFIKGSTSLAAAALPGYRLIADQSKQEKQPNILFIMTDQQHANMMSCAGNKLLSTPTMDSIARNGVRFTKAYAANPVCVPSRTSMATGMMPNRLGAHGNGAGMRIEAVPSEVNEHSMGKLMKAAGYDTFYGGKVHMCKDLDPKNAGYDVYFRDERDKLPGACLEFINRKRNKPWFAVASFINPHDICFAHLAHCGKDRQGVMSLYEEARSLPDEQLPPLPGNYAIPEGEPESITAQMSPKAVTPAITMRKEYDERAWRIKSYIYHRLTEKVDKNIGEIVNGLKQAGMEQDTIVIFLSDHGDMDGSHRLASKGLMYEESAGVPFLFSGKGIRSGMVNEDHLVSTGLDLLPTICDYAGIEKPAHMLGQSLRPLLEGRNPSKWRSYVVSENDWCRMVRTRRFKYCSFAYSDKREESLVDMVKDPGEMKNLALDPSYKDVLDRHRKMLAQWSKRSIDKEAAPFLRTG